MAAKLIPFKEVFIEKFTFGTFREWMNQIDKDLDSLSIVGMLVLITVVDKDGKRIYQNLDEVFKEDSDLVHEYYYESKRINPPPQIEEEKKSS
jgi:hypothetical protein